MADDLDKRLKVFLDDQDEAKRKGATTDAILHQVRSTADWALKHEQDDEERQKEVLGHLRGLNLRVVDVENAVGSNGGLPPHRGRLPSWSDAEDTGQRQIREIDQLRVELAQKEQARAEAENAKLEAVTREQQAEQRKAEAESKKDRGEWWRVVVAAVLGGALVGIEELLRAAITALIKIH